MDSWACLKNSRNSRNKVVHLAVIHLAAMQLFFLLVAVFSVSRAEETLDFIGLARPKLIPSPLSYQVDLDSSTRLTIPLIRLPSPSLTVETWQEGAIVSQLTIDPSCLYFGESSARVAVNLCDGMSAIVDTETAQYLIRPRRTGFSGVSAVHEVHRLRKSDTPSTIAYLDPNVADRRRRRLRRASARSTVELGLVADRDFVQFYGNHTETYLLTIMNVVSNIYDDATVSDLVDVILTRLILLQDDTLGLTVTPNADRTLTDFCMWQRGINYPRGTRHHYDVAVLLTRKDICDGKRDCDLLGLANTGSACEPKRSCAVVQDVGFTSSLAIAHELGHLLGMKHDDVSCSLSSSNQIMSSSLSSASRLSRTRWSDCSRRYLMEFLSGEQSECLADVPAVEHDYISTNQGKTVKGLLPGELFAHERESQCQFLYGSLAKPCHTHTQDSKCHSLMCRVPGQPCTGIPLADFTPCGSKMYCISGKCSPVRSPQNGGWSEWAPYSTCTRTCGGGVRLSRRKCDNPRPQNGGHYCDGDSIRFKSCAISNCPSNEPSFRDVQCAKRSFKGDAKWTAKQSSAKSDLCLLVCARGSTVAVLAATVIDGTPCGVDSSGRCVQGQCIPAGCDNVIGSNKTLDSCGVCGGNNLFCEMVKGQVKPSHTGIEAVIDIPPGATKVEIKQNSAGHRDGCYLALQTTTGRYIFNGNYNIQMHKGIFSAAGSEVQYSGAGASEETIQVKGPTLEKLTVKSLNFVSNPPEISYKFSVRRNEISKEYEWKHESVWSTCTKQCQGVQFKRVFCTSSSGEIVQDSYCNDISKPQPQQQSCNRLCPAEWVTGNFTSCSASCGRGLMKRSVVCKQGDVVVLETLCPKEKPKAFIECNSDLCPTWKTGPWNQCSSVCGGTQSRTVQCIDWTGKEVSLTLCSNTERPSNSRECSLVKGDCRGAHWRKTEWSKCNIVCGKGFVSRRVFCSNSLGNELPDKICGGKKPTEVRTCRGKSCGTWKVGNWQECSTTCGVGVRRRSVLCVLPDGRESKGCFSKKPLDTKQCRRRKCPKNVANACRDEESYCASYVASSRSFCFIEVFRQKCCYSCRVQSR